METKPATNVKTKYSVVTNLVAIPLLTLATVSANAATEVALPTVSVENLIGFIALLVAAIATVATANLLIPMTAKGIKSIRSAF